MSDNKFKDSKSQDASFPEKPLKLTLRERIERAADQRKKHVQETNLFGEKVWLRRLSASQRDKFEADRFNCKIKLQDGKTSGDAVLNLENHRARFVAMALSDEEGKQLYSEKNPKDIEMIGGWDQGEIDRLYDEGMLFNDMDDEAVSRAEKNLIPSQA